MTRGDVTSDDDSCTAIHCILAMEMLGSDDHPNLGMSRESVVSLILYALDLANG